MEYPDLYLFPESHPPSPYDHPVMIMREGRFGDGYLPRGLTLYAVGWIEKKGFPTGPVPEDCIQALFSAHADHIIPEGTRGIHTCMLCNISTPEVRWHDKTLTLLGHGHYLVRKGEAVYMAPELVLHYILDHRYSPPREFVQAVVQGKFLTQDDLDVRWRNE